MVEKHSQTKYVILAPGVSNAPAVGNPLYNNSNGLLTLPVNGVAIYGPVAGSGNHQEVSASPGNAIKIIKRRDTTGDNSPLYTRLFEDSDWINAFCRNQFNISAIAADTGTNSSHLVGAANAAASGQIEVQDNLNYQVQVSGHGDRTDWFNGAYNTPTTFGFYQAPDFTALGYTDAQSRDLITQELALDFNSKSRQMSFAICIDAAGTAPGTGAILISDLANTVTTPVGTPIVIGYDSQGRQHTFVMTKEIQATFAELATLVPAGALMKPYVVPGTVSGPATAVASVAGTLVSETDHLFFIALDEAKAAYDYRVNTKRRIEVGLVEGFTTTAQAEITKAYEGQGQFHQLDIQFRKHNRYEETHRSRFPYQSYYLEFNQSGLLKDATYDYFVIEHCDDRTATSGMPSFNNFTTIVAVVSFEDPSTPYFTGAANPQKTYIQDALNLFVTNNNLSIPTLAI